MSAAAPLHIFLVAGEESGDRLGAWLMTAIRAREPSVRFSGVGGTHMTAAGISSPFPIHDVAVMGLSGILGGLFRLLNRLRIAAEAAAASKPDLMVLIDSPEFTHRVARRVRRNSPTMPVVDYVAPSVWAWRPGRARAMKAYVDRVMAVLPFEPEVFQRLGGPPCEYVGHPLIEDIDRLRPGAGERPALAETRRPTLLILPGSRRGEIRRHMGRFGEALKIVSERRGGELEAVLPAVPHLAAPIRDAVAAWPVKASVVEGDEAKHAALRGAHAALAASGTVTLELALSGVPMAVAYVVEPLIRPLRFLVNVPSIVLPNLVLGENAIPEFVNADATPQALADAVVPLLRDSPERRRQVAAFGRIDGLMQLDRGVPSDRAAEIVLNVAQEARAAMA